MATLSYHYQPKKKLLVTMEWSKVNMTVLSSAAPEIPPVHDPSTDRLRTGKEIIHHTINLKKHLRKLLWYTPNFGITHLALYDTLQKLKEPLDSSNPTRPWFHPRSCQIKIVVLNREVNWYGVMLRI